MKLKLRPQEKTLKNRVKRKAIRRFSQEEILKVITLYKSGKTSFDIGNLLRRDEAVICYILKKNGVARRTFKKAHNKGSVYKGKRFSLLVVTGTIRKKFGNKYRTLLKVTCDCGKRKFVYSSSLKSGKTKSCGCWGKKVSK